MSALVTLTPRDGIGVITIANPPVNGLGSGVRTGLVETLQAALADDTLRAVVVTGAGAMFSGGADIREFGRAGPAGTPPLPAIVDMLEASPKPVVAALHGVAAGGGLEVALGCHYRVAAPTARVGLPEVTLGIVPGAGGTQRLPRLTGAAAALEVLTGGQLLPAARARALGIIDEIVDGDLIEGACAAAWRLVEGALPVRRTRDLQEKIAAARATPGLFNEFRSQMARRSRGFEAPSAAVECVEAAVSLPFEEGLAKERETFLRLVDSAQARALRHVFFAEREASKIPDLPPDTPAAAVAQAAVVGLGTMGSGIAICLANAGIPVHVLDISQELLDRGLSTVRKSYASAASKGQLTQADVDRRLSLITPGLDYTGLAGADIVIEAVFEEMGLKREVFARLDAVCKPDAILATNTSTLDVNQIAAATRRPDRVMGMHFFSPAHVMRLVENVRGAATSRETIATVMQLSKTIGKIGVLVGVCDGFVGNRMLYAYRRQAEFLLEEGALPQQVDRVLYDFGLPMGPFAMADLAGLDVGWRIRKRQTATRPPHLRYSPIADRICELGRFGQKTGAGWYRYDPGSRTPVPDPAIEALIHTVSHELGIARRRIDDDEILQRCLYPPVNEGAKILDEGVALRASDIDVLWIHGYGFPRYRGGPMFWADAIGLPAIHETMCRLHREHGDWLRPAPLLEQLVTEGKGFAEVASVRMERARGA